MAICGALFAAAAFEAKAAASEKFVPFVVLHVLSVCTLLGLGGTLLVINWLHGMLKLQKAGVPDAVYWIVRIAYGVLALGILSSITLRSAA